MSPGPEWWLVYLALGLVVGFFAGLLGIGGGILVVPALALLFGLQHFDPDHVMHLALGTSLASILFTGVHSTRSHHHLGNVRWAVWRACAAGAFAGTLGGAALAQRLPTHGLSLLFSAFTCYCALQLLLDHHPRPTRHLPGPFGLGVASLVVGTLCSLVGAGGGIIAVPMFVACNMPLRQAIGTSAALAIPIALGGSAGYLAHGLGAGSLPVGAVGYVYLPALVGIVAGTLITVPLGARACSHLPVTRLRHIFAGLLLLVAARMAFSLL